MWLKKAAAELLFCASDITRMLCNADIHHICPSLNVCCKANGSLEILAGHLSLKLAIQAGYDMCLNRFLRGSHLDIEQHHGMVQQVGHFGDSPILALLFLQGLTQLPSLFPYLAAQKLLVVGQLGSPGRLAACSLSMTVSMSLQYTSCRVCSNGPACEVQQSASLSIATYDQKLTCCLFESSPYAKKPS